MPTLQINTLRKVKATRRSGFDYTQLKPDDAKRLRIAKDRLENLVKSSFETVIRIGNELNQVKKILGHGRFTTWLSAEFAWTPRMARNFMSVADRFTPGLVNSDLIAPTAAYLLAAPSTPESACVEAVKRAEQGEEITVARAREIIRRTKASERYSGHLRSTQIDSAGLKQSLIRLKSQWPSNQIRLYAEELQRFVEELSADENGSGWNGARPTLCTPEQS